MRDEFFQFYRPNDDDFKYIWDHGLFVFDTSTILNLYRYSKNTAEKMIEILKKLKEEDRIWLPYNVAYEYHQNRLTVIHDQTQTYKQVNSVIDETMKTFNKGIEKFHRHPYIDIEYIKEKIDKCFSEIKEELEKKEKDHPDFREDDVINEMLNTLFNGKIGEETNEEEYKKIIEEGKQRYKKELPPGYADQNDKGKKDCYDLLDEREYGDLVIWKQIIKEAEEINKPIVFITDDKKEDWWLREPGGKTWGPRPELIKEIREEAGVLFYMYKSDIFLTYAKKYLSSEVDDKTIDEVAEISNFRKAIDETVERAYKTPPLPFADFFENEYHRIQDSIEYSYKRLSELDKDLKDVFDKYDTSLNPEEKNRWVTTISEIKEQKRLIREKIKTLKMNKRVIEGSLGFPEHP